MPSRSGAALLEVMIALTILATAAASIVAFANEAARGVVRSRDSAKEIRRASGLLDAVTLWPREDLDRHLGTRREGTWRMQITRPTNTLYMVVLFDSLGARELLRTMTYRRESTNDKAQTNAR